MIAAPSVFFMIQMTVSYFTSNLQFLTNQIKPTK